MQNDIAIIVGNGLLFDLLASQRNALKRWNPQSPTMWREQPAINGGHRMLDVLPLFQKFVRRCRSENSAVTDFEIFNKLVTRPPIEVPPSMDPHQAYCLQYNHDMAMVEARHFVVAAFGVLQTKFVRKCDLRQWRWAHWLNAHARSIGAITSFNYDLVLEDTLSLARIGFRRSGLGKEQGKIEIHKPHGSIDFVCDQIQAPRGYPLRNLVSRNNLPISRVDRFDFARLDAEIVLPSEASSISGFQWVVAGTRSWNARASSARHLVLAGLSYWECDRDELDALVDAVAPDATVHMCNPKPSDVWLEKLRSRFSDDRVKVWDTPPDLAG